jgi:hypothetical protein
MIGFRNSYYHAMDYRLKAPENLSREQILGICTHLAAENFLCDLNENLQRLMERLHYVTDFRILNDECCMQLGMNAVDYRPSGGDNGMIPCLTIVFASRDYVFTFCHRLCYTIRVESVDNVPCGVDIYYSNSLNWLRYNLIINFSGLLSLFPMPIFSPVT